MSKKKLRIVHYINQFFAQIGGEEKANILPLIKEGPVGPGLLLEKLLNGEAEIIATAICGDSYFAESIEEASQKLISLITPYKPDVLIAGPAFSAGRYGMACGAICKAVKEKLNIPTLTAMHPENPGVESYRKYTYILPTTTSAKGFKEVAPMLSSFCLKLCQSGEIGFPEEEGYIPQGFRVNIWANKRGAARAVEMLAHKIRGEEFKNELPMPKFDRVSPAPAVKDLSKAVIALVTSGGIVPKGNPDRLEAHNASKYLKYDIANVEDLKSGDYETAHGGYDPVYANDDPDRILPLDVTRELEKEGVIRKLFDYYYVTVGNTTAVASAERFGKSIGEELKKAGVNGVILTST